MMILFVHSARLAMVTFDPYLSSRPLAETLNSSPSGGMIVDDQYYTFSSVFFYADREGLLLNGRINNLEYGSYAPGAPAVFIDDSRFEDLWRGPERQYLLASETGLPRLGKVVGEDRLHLIARSGGKVLLSNHPGP
jgi:hypothetical protein